MARSTSSLSPRHGLRAKAAAALNPHSFTKAHLTQHPSRAFSASCRTRIWDCRSTLRDRRADGASAERSMQAGIPHTAIQTEHRGSTARRMQCVHCKGITEDVAIDPFVCAHCGLNLFVRDHYSRRLARLSRGVHRRRRPRKCSAAKGIYE